MRLLQRCRVNFVVLRDSPMDTVDHRRGLAWQMRDAKGSLPAFDTRPRGIDDITHGYLLPEKSILSTSELLLKELLEIVCGRRGTRNSILQALAGRIANRRITGLMCYLPGNGSGLFC